MIPHHADHLEKCREALASSSNITATARRLSSTQTEMTRRGRGASRISRKMTICDYIHCRGWHWFRKIWERCQYEWLVLVSSTEGRVEKRAQTSYYQPSHIILHTETASRFLENDKASWEAYCQLLADTADYIRTLTPKAKVGIYATSYDTSEEIALMSKKMDYFSFGYNADTGDLNHKELIEKIFALAGDRQVGIHEIGIPTSSIVKGSQEKQIEFVNLIFDFATTWGKKLEFMAYYQGFDEDPAVTSVWLPATFPDWTDQMKTEGIAWFGSLGLHTFDGKPKPAWNTFKTRIADYATKTK